MSGANICDTETYEQGGGILGKCSVTCSSLIHGNKDSLDRNCERFCKGCYTYLSAEANETQVNPTILPPSFETTSLPVGEIVGISLGISLVVSIFVIIIYHVVVILAYRNSKCFRSRVHQVLKLKEVPAVNGQQGTTTREEDESHKLIDRPGSSPAQPHQPASSKKSKHGTNDPGEGTSAKP